MSEGPEKAVTQRRVAAAERTLALLNVFIGQVGPVSLRDLEATTGLFRSVIFRYMISFEECGYVKKTSEGKYLLTGKVLQLAAAFESHLDLGKAAQPVLNHLSRVTRESAVFYVPSEEKRLCLARVDSPQTVRVSMRPGTALPIDGSATGLVFQRYAGRPPATDIRAGRPITTSGVADPSSASVSAPVFSAREGFVGAMTVSGPVSRFDCDDPDVAAALLEAVVDLNTTLGAVVVYR